MDDRKADRPAGECDLRVTPEMIEAGLPLLYRYDPEWGTGTDGEETVARIFSAMYRVFAQSFAATPPPSQESQSGD